MCWPPCCLLPWVMESFVCEPVIMGPLPASMNLWQGYLASLQGGWIPGPFTIFNSLINGLTVWDADCDVAFWKKEEEMMVSNGSWRKSMGISSNVLTKLDGQPGNNGPLLCHLLTKRTGEAVAIRLWRQCLGCCWLSSGQEDFSPIWWAALSLLGSNDWCKDSYWVGGKFYSFFRQHLHRLSENEGKFVSARVSGLRTLALSLGR